MDNSSLAATFALFAAVAWGSGDFTNGTVARRVGTFQAVLISYIVGLVGLTIIAVARQEQLPPAHDLFWGALAGLLGMVGLGFLLRGFSVGRMGIVAPVSAVLATALPVIFAVLTEGLPRQWQILGFGLALFAIWFLARPEESGNRPTGLSLALLAGLGFGGFFIALSQIKTTSVFWPLVAGRLACCMVLAAFAIFTRRPFLPSRSSMGLLALAGVLDVGGNFFFLLATQTGRLDVAAVLGSLYPAVTTILARLIHREHMTRLQGIGVVAAILAIALITI